jgi:hypothetical protein
VGGTRAKVLSIAETSRQNSTKDSSYYYYSQPGRWKWDVLQRDPRPRGTVRSDCSQWVISVYYKAGCSLPGSMRGQGNTTTLLGAGKRTTTPVPGDCVLYSGHVELYVGNNKTIGHGDAKVDFSTPHRRSGFKGFYKYDFLD